MSASCVKDNAPRSAVIRIKMNGNASDRIVKSLGQEDDVVQRSRVRLLGSGRCLKIIITADDTSSLRAALNSFLRWAHLADSINKVAKKRVAKHIENAFSSHEMPNTIF